MLHLQAIINPCEMKKLFVFVIVLVVGMMNLYSLPIDRTLAQSAAQKFATARFAAERAMPELVYTGQDEAFFVYNVGDHSFVIIAGDDAHRPVIGYSDESAFDVSNIPPALAYYLDGVAECILQLHHAVATPEVAAEWNSVLQHGRLISRHGGRGTGYFCQTKWNQTYPYNYCCPDDPAGSGGHAIVGCLATAMSQLMRFWAYPAQAIAIIITTMARFVLISVIPHTIGTTCLMCWTTTLRRPRNWPREPYVSIAV